MKSECAKVEKGIDYSSLGKVWEKNGYRRLYLDSGKVAEIVGLKYGCYNTGNIWWAELNGEKISNSQCRRILGSWMDAYIDLNADKVCSRHGKVDFADEILDAYKAMKEGRGIAQEAQA